MTEKIETINDLPGVGPATAEKLSQNGFDTLMSIAVAPIGKIVDLTGLSEPKARTIIQAARDSLNVGFTKATDIHTKKTETVFKIPTGSEELDNLMKGGVESGLVTEAHGVGGCGKTQLAHQLCVNLQLLDETNKAIYIDSEGSFRTTRIVQMAEANKQNPQKVLENITYIQVFNSDHQMLMVEKAEEEIKKDPSIRLLIVDSIIEHFRNEYQGRGQLADRQAKINKHIHNLLRIAQIYNVVVYITNQVMSDPGNPYGDPIKPAGGNVITHAVRTRLYLRKSSKGVTAKLVKSGDIEDGETIFQVTTNGIRD